MCTIHYFCLWVEKSLIFRLMKLNTFADYATDYNRIFVGYRPCLWSDFFFSLWKLSKNVGGLSLPLLWIFSGMMCLVVGLDVVFPLSVSLRSSMEGDKMKCCGDGFTGRPECEWQAVMCSCMMASQVVWCLADLRDWNSLWGERDSDLLWNVFIMFCYQSRPDIE